MPKGLTIGQAADFAGVTVKTMRHYHKLGLVKKPPRDDSGYRRYTSNELLRLVQVRTLAEAGVPLAEISGLLAANPTEFAARVEQVQRQLTARIEELIHRREALSGLEHGNRLLLPESACFILERFNELGFQPEYVSAQRESLVLFRALFPEDLGDFVNHLTDRLSDPVYVELEKRSWEAATWSPNDPRLVELAAELTDNLLRHLPQAMPTGMQSRADSAERYRLVNDHQGDVLPAVTRLNELITANLRAAGINLPTQNK